MDWGLPSTMSFATMVEHPNFELINDIVDQDRDLCLRFRGEEDSGGEDDNDS